MFTLGSCPRRLSYFIFIAHSNARMSLHIHLYTLYVYFSRASLHFIAYDIMRKNIYSAEAEGDGI